MAIFKVLLLATVPFMATPQSSFQPGNMNVGVVDFRISTPANADESLTLESHGNSTIYKNQPTPEFLLKSTGEAEEQLLIFPDYDSAVVGNRSYLEV